MTDFKGMGFGLNRGFSDGTGFGSRSGFGDTNTPLNPWTRKPRLGLGGLRQSLTDNPWADLGDVNDNLSDNTTQGLTNSTPSDPSVLKPFGRTGGYSQLPPLTQYTQVSTDKGLNGFSHPSMDLNSSFLLDRGQNNKTKDFGFSTRYLDSLWEKPQQTLETVMRSPQQSSVTPNFSADSWYTSQLKPSLGSPLNVCLPQTPKTLSLEDYPTSIQAGYWNQIARDRGMSFRPYQFGKLFSDLNLQNQNQMEIKPSYRTDIENYVPLWSPQSAAERQKYDDWLVQEKMKINLDHEGESRYSYFDSGGNVTFGKGHMSPNEGEFITHPWKNVQTDDFMTPQAKRAFWQNIQPKRRDYCAFDEQRNLTKCNTRYDKQTELQGAFLSDAYIDELQRADLMKALNQVKKGFSNLNELSQIVIEDKATDTLLQRQQKESLRKLYSQFAGKKLDFYQVDPYAVMENIDYRFNTGQPFSKTPNKIYNLYQHNFEEAAKHSHRKKPISDERNNWSANMYRRSKNFWKDL